MRILILFALVSVCQAHVGSPDVFYEGSAGPYRLLVTIRPPQVVPGVAEVEIRSPSPDVREIRIAPVPLTGPAAQYPPTPDILHPTKEDPQFYTGSVWLMACCSWQVRIYVDGSQGKAEMAVPVVGVATRTLQMEKTMGATLLFFLIVLAFGAVSISGVYAREGQLAPGVEPDPHQERRGRRVMLVTGVLVVAMIYLGKLWWDSDDNAFQRFIYKPLKMTAALEPAGRLALRLETSGWLQSVDDLLPDHTHLMHLYLIRLPDMERIWHLHPEMTSAGNFSQDLPTIPQGRYQIYADIVHGNGLPETLVTQIELPDVPGKPLTGDDAAGQGPPLSAATANRTVADLSDGYRLIWERPSTLAPGRLTSFQFRVEDRDGKPATDLELYMGMQGHAAFVKTDGSVFAHIHPSGTVPMAALALAQGDPHAGHAMGRATLPPVVSFPYALPKPGAYRIIVQIKRAGHVETAVFDVTTS
jgi:hypothetical protein